MTINDLVVSDTTVNKFKRAAHAQYKHGGPPVCQKARTAFFTELRQEYGLEHIKPHLPKLYMQLTEWENEARSNGNAA